MDNKVELPDFNDLLALARQIGEKKTALEVLKASLSVLRADITAKVTTNTGFWDDGKKPSNSHIRDTFHYTGYDADTRDRLYNLMTEIANFEGSLKSDESLFRIYTEMIGVWRTQSANERKI